MTSASVFRDGLKPIPVAHVARRMRYECLVYRLLNRACRLRMAWPRMEGCAPYGLWLVRSGPWSESSHHLWFDRLSKHGNRLLQMFDPVPSGIQR
jgi:hypothetical protein